MEVRISIAITLVAWHMSKPRATLQKRDRKTGLQQGLHYREDTTLAFTGLHNSPSLFDVYSLNAFPRIEIGPTSS